MFPGDGEMARRMREFDWSSTGPGDPETWPAGLREACRICLTSRYPMNLWWGSQLWGFYNDAFLPLLGDKHPALGMTAEQVWGEIWDVVGPLLRSVLETGRAIWSEDMPLTMNRHGYEEETYWTYSYSPLFDGDTVGGVLTVCNETTERVLSDRRQTALRRLGGETGVAHSVEEACGLVAAALERARADVPFAAVYMRGPDEDDLRLMAASPSGADPRPRADGPGGWPVQEVLRSGRPVAVDDVAERFGALPAGDWGAPPNQAMVLPLPGEGDAGPVGAIVLAAGAGRVLDDAYRSFLELVARQAAALVNGALAYRAQRRRAEELAELNRAKTVFFSDISHEFRTPLTLIMGPLEELRAGLRDADQWVRDDLEIVHRNGLRMQKLVNTLLDFSRIEAGRMRARYEPVDLAVFTADLAGIFRAAVEKAGLEFEVDCPPLPEPVHVDRGMWEKIVLNLLSNALKFTFAGSVGVRLRAEDGQAVLRVSDTGIGVAEQDLPRLFERFHRIEAARSRSHEGSGIGLALVRELVLLHGGTITVGSVEGEGTTFTVRLPFGHAHLPEDGLAPADRPVEASAGVDPYVEEALRWLPEETGPDRETLPGLLRPPYAASVPRVGGRARVLVADDNADMRDYLRRLLRPGYEVETARDGLEALEAARADPPDLVVSDVMMPRMDGLRLVAVLRSEPRTAGVPVLLLSALAGEGASVEGLAAGADDYLIKPFAAAELLARVRATVELARLRNRQARWRDALLDSLQEAFFVVDDRGAVIEINTAFTELLGYGPEGLPYELLYPWWPDAADDPEAHQQSVDAFLQMVDRAGGSQIVPVTHRDGRRLWVVITFKEVHDPDTDRQVVVGTMRDVTAELAAARRDMALANMSLRLSGTSTLPETLRAALEEMAGVWEARRVLAATWNEAGRVNLCSSGAQLGWEELPGPVRAAVEGLRTRPPLRPVTFTEPAGVGMTLEHLGGPLVIWIEPDPHRPFVPEDHALLVGLCGYLSQSLQHLSLVGQQRQIALEFQRVILDPSQLPAGFTVRYEPAARPLQVGGDWYDVFGLPDGRIGIVVGDCVGRGVPAAAVMGQLRSACRALLLQLAEPAATLTAMDGFAELVPNAVGTTLFCGILDTGTGRLTYSSAGHLPGIGVHADGRTELLEGGRGVPLAVAPEISRPEADFLLPPRSTVLLYTDGLVERRHESLDIGIGQAVEVIRDGRGLPLESLAQEVMRRMLPDGGYDDDVALLLYRRPAGLEVPFAADAGRLAHVRAELRRWLDGLDLDPLVVQNVVTAVGEACANAVEHGHRDTPGSTVRLTASVTGDELRVTVADSGRWRPPRPDTTHERGRGLYLIHALMQEVTIDHGPTGTTVDMRARITA